MTLSRGQITFVGTDSHVITEFWRRTARSRLHFELAGLAFALQKGFSAEDYAHHLWSQGAIRWMSNPAPSAGEYLLKEAEAFRRFYPDVTFEIVEAGEERAELVFTEGCLGGWGKDPWRLARSLNMAEEDVCSYCREAFLVWAGQLGLAADIGRDKDKGCRLRVAKSSYELLIR